jgi:amino acid adenylation domain-containing protein/thioester reductase-like protein
MRSTAPDRCLHDLFADQVRRSPGAPALVDATTSLTYAELDRRAERLAASLRAAGVGPDVLVGVLMERRAEYVIACLAALKAGGAFLVLELAYPPELLADVIADAAPRVVVTLAAHTDRLAPDQERIVLDGDDDAADAGAADEPAHARATPGSLAFVSYSSGTTGRPKGIANPHCAAVRSYWWRFGISDQQPGDRVACNVFFIWEMLRPLLRGATVHVVGDDVIYDPAALVRFLREHRSTEILMTSSLLEAVLARTGTTLGAQVPDLRVLWLNGEIVTRTLARRALDALPDTRVLNVYSASESHEIAAGDLRDLVDLDTTFCAVGRPLDPEHTYVLDAQRVPVPAGSEGELYVGGSCLAREYLNLPGTTAEAFVADPFTTAPGARMYRTGDRARLVGDGMLEITGRVGSMIKIRGYSVEPGAVEVALERSLAVRTAAVVPHGAEGADKRLVAYVVREADAAAIGDRAAGWTLDASGRSPDIRRALGGQLPHYMVPTVYVEVAALPVHSSGKVDLERLPPPPPEAAATVHPGGAPVTHPDRAPVTAEALAGVWAAVLQVPGDRIGAHDDFFDLGGHSLAVAELGTRVSETFGVDVPLTELVARPTPAGHRDIVRGARHGRLRDTRVDLHGEAGLDADIRPRATAGWRALTEAGVILLTGATGFLGGFLLAALLRSTPARVLCLVRPTDDGGPAHRTAARRLRAALDGRGLWRAEHAGRVTALPGDLGEPLLGMAEGAFESLAGEVDAIVHAGAQVNLMYPYTALRAVNVGGTREVLRLACRGGATPVHHVSTSGVLPPSGDRWREDAPLDEVAGDLADGYAQSKWVAEQLVHEAGRRGLPVWVYRPGTISGHSATGSANARDLLGALISESLHLGCVPDVDGWYAEMTPVDYVSDAISRLAADACSGDRVFHLSDPDPLPARTLFHRLARLGYRTEHVDWDEWVERWRARRAREAGSGPADVLRGGMPSRDDLRAVTVLDDRATRPHLERHGLRRPRIDGDLLAAYTRHFHEEGWLDTPPGDRHGSAE